ncbi:MAG: histidinol-phosphatase HisJ family protein [Ruminococcaceae bacterium]|nr:histidinol-phosphatase HisJ family protein [Oscillospiraceae bacterium]
MYYDMHTHSHFSTDSHMEMEKGILSAINKNLSGIAFTDHIDIDFTNREDEYLFDLDEYFVFIDKMIDKYKDKIKILRAVEVGIQDHVLEETKKKVQGYPHDFVLGSTHLFHRLDPYEKEFWDDGRDKKAVYLDCLECIYKNIQIYNDFDVLSHLDYQVRNAVYEDNRFFYNDYSDLVDSIFKFIIEKGIGFEINTSTYSKVPLDTDLVKRYLELGGEIITIGSDAHYPENVGKIFPEIIEILKNSGVKYIAHYIERKPVFDKLV